MRENGTDVRWRWWNGSEDFIGFECIVDKINVENWAVDDKLLRCVVLTVNQPITKVRTKLSDVLERVGWMFRAVL